MLFYSKRRRYYKRSDPAKFNKAAEMRNNPTRAEARMYEILYSEVVPKYPEYIFYRQSVQFGYILDFYCPRLRLGIEVDGSMHDEQREYDYYRDNNLARHGIEICRFSNDEVLYNPQETADKIYQTLKEKNAHPPRGYTKEGCFIATAAYGTATAGELDVLRKFRDVRLYSSLVGRNIADLYYFVSPPIARIIVRSNELRAFVRDCLSPIINFLKRKGY